MPKARKPKERKFIVKTDGVNYHVDNEEFSDIEMIGALTVVLEAYKERFKGGGANAPKTNPERG